MSVTLTPRPRMVLDRLAEVPNKVTAAVKEMVREGLVAAKPGPARRVADKLSATSYAKQAADSLGVDERTVRQDLGHLGGTERGLVQRSDRSCSAGPLQGSDVEYLTSRRADDLRGTSDKGSPTDG